MYIDEYIPHNDLDLLILYNNIRRVNFISDFHSSIICYLLKLGIGILPAGMTLFGFISQQVWLYIKIFFLIL